MLAVAILLCLLLSQVNGITTDAKCLAGYEWMFSSIGQSPCDIAAELAAVCAGGGKFNLEPLDFGYVYSGPTQANQNSCRCSSVYYSLLSACGFCQGRNFLWWSDYKVNCSTIYITVYNQPIPIGVKVPAYAYQNVSVSDTFNVTLAHSMMDGVESSRPPSSSTSSPAATSTSVNSNEGTNVNIPAIVGGVIALVIGLGGLVLILCLRLRRRRSKSQIDDHSSRLNANTSLMSNTTPIMSGPLGSSENDLVKYSPSMNSPYREHSPPFRFQTLTPDDTGASAQNPLPSHTRPQYTGLRSQYSGSPEL